MRLFSKELLMYDKNYSKANWQTVNTTVTGESIASRTFLEAFVYCNDKYWGVYKNFTGSLGSISSENGIDWTTYMTSGQLAGVTIYDMEVYDKGNIVAVGKNQNNEPIITVNYSKGAVWGVPKKIQVFGLEAPRTIANLNGILYAVKRSVVYRTTGKKNPESWSSLEPGAVLRNVGAELCCAGRDKIVAIGTASSSENQLYISSNGRDWENIGKLPSTYPETSQVNEWVSMCYDGKKYIAVSLYGTYTISHDLQNWTSIKTIEDFSTSSLTRVKAGNGKILLFNCDGTTPLTEITYAEI